MASCALAASFDYQKIDAPQCTYATKQYVGYRSSRAERFFQIAADVRRARPTLYCMIRLQKFMRQKEWRGTV
jgi:hypothetical protein